MPLPVGYGRDALRVTLVLAGLIALAFLPFALGLASLMNASSLVPSLYPYGAAPHAHAAPVESLKVLDFVGGWLSEPWLAIEHRLLWSLQTPFWDAHDGYGNPYAASMVTQPFSPFMALFGLAPATPLTFNLQCLARLLAAGVGAALFVRLFAGFVPSLVAGIAAALSGYYIGFITQAHLSVEVLVAAMLLGTELVIRAPGTRSIAACAAITAAMFLGGMPETSLLLMIVTGAYAAFRVAVTGRRLARAGALLAAYAIGGGLSAFFMLPFVEFMRFSNDIHQSSASLGRAFALAHDTDLWHVIATELVPLAFGPVWADQAWSVFGGMFPAMRGYVGSCAMLLAVLAVVAAIVRARRRETVDGVVAFLAVLVVVCLAKRMGHPLVQWIADLPFLRLIIFEKYVEPIVGTATALLAGFGVAAVLERGARRAEVAVAAGFALLVLSGAYLHAPPAGYGDPQLHFRTLAFVLAIVCLFACAVALLGAARAARPPRALTTVLTAAVFVELALCYPIPVFAVMNGMVPASLDPYKAPDYVRFLQARSGPERWRVFGTGGTLHPDWPGAFGLDSPGLIDAMYYGDYTKFMDSFDVSDPPLRPLDADRYNGQRTTALGSSLHHRWLALSSARYVVTPRDNGEAVVSNEFLTTLWSQNYMHVLNGPPAALHRPVVGRRAEDALVQQPPSHTIATTLTVPRDRPYFAVDTATVPPAAGTASGYGRPCGGATRLTFRAYDPSGTVAAAFARTSPDGNGVWQRNVVDLRPLAGRQVQIFFSSDPVGRSAGCRARSAWGEPRFVASPAAARRNAAAGPFALVFQGSANVYEARDVLPRVTVLRDVRAVRSVDEALAVLTAPQFDERRTAVVVARSAPRFAGCGGTDRAGIDAASNGTVAISVDLACPGLVMLNDTDYPGWLARLDGTAVPVLRTDALFRGVVVPAGRHRLQYVYAPTSLRRGALLSLAAALAFIALLLFPLPARSRRAAGERRPVLTNGEPPCVASSQGVQDSSEATSPTVSS